MCLMDVPYELLENAVDSKNKLNMTHAIATFFTYSACLELFSLFMGSLFLRCILVYCPGEPWVVCLVGHPCGY